MTTAIIPMGHPIPRRVISQEGDWVIVDISTTPRPLPKAYRQNEVKLMDIVDKNTGEVTQQPEEATDIKDKNGALIFSNQRVNTPDGTGMTQILNGDLWKVKLSTGTTKQYNPDEIEVVPQSTLEDKITKLKAQLASLKSERDVAKAMQDAAERKLKVKEQEHKKALEDAQHKTLTDHKFGELASLKKTNAELTDTISKLKAALNNAHKPDRELEIKTIVGDLSSLPAFDMNLANHINDGWTIVTVGDVSGKFVVILSRPKADDQPAQQIAVTEATPQPESSLSVVKDKMVTTFTELFRMGASPEEVIKGCNIHAVKKAKQQYQQLTGVTL